MQQAIIGTYDGPVYWPMYVSLSLKEVRSAKPAFKFGSFLWYI